MAKKNKTSRKTFKKFVVKSRKKHNYQKKQKDWQATYNVTKTSILIYENKYRKPCADMHVHLDVPDSYNKLEDVVKNAKLFGTYTLGIADHNYTGTRLGIGKFLHENNVPYDKIIVSYDDETTIIPGIEVSTHCNNLAFHLVVFGANRDPEIPLNKLVRMEYEKKYIQYNFYYSLLKEFGSSITYEEYQGINKTAHIENEYLTDMNGIVLLDYIRNLTINQYEKNLAHEILSSSSNNVNPYIMHDSDAFSCFKLRSEDVIRLVHDAGGIAIWAHPPLSIQNTSSYTTAYNKLIDAGLDGVEAFGELNAFNSHFGLKSKIKRDKLILSAGSDRHIPNRCYGAVRGACGHPIFEDELPILKVLYDMDKQIRPDVKHRSITEALKEYGEDNPIEYEKMLNSAKVNFVRNLIYQKSDLYQKYFGIKKSLLIKYINNPLNETFLISYFNYFCSEDVGVSSKSPMNKLAELINKNLNESSTVNKNEISTKISEDFIKECESDFNNEKW